MHTDRFMPHAGCVVTILHAYVCSKLSCCSCCLRISQLKQPITCLQPIDALPLHYHEAFLFPKENIAQFGPVFVSVNLCLPVHLPAAVRLPGAGSGPGPIHGVGRCAQQTQQAFVQALQQQDCIHSQQQQQQQDCCMTASSGMGRCVQQRSSRE